MSDSNLKPMCRYTLHNTGESSAKYGKCEVCGRHASEVWYQIEERTYEPLPGDTGPFWTHEGCVNLFGHKKCLLAQHKSAKRKRTRGR
jgi:hypothetical protein